MSKIVLNDRENFPLKHLSRFKDIAVFVVGSFLLPHPADGKYSERVQLPTKAKFGFFCHQHLATLATLLLDCYCKPAIVYILQSFLTVTSTSLDRNETPFPPMNLPIQSGTNPSTIFLVIVVTDRQTDTHTHTNQRR